MRVGTYSYQLFLWRKLFLCYSLAGYAVCNDAERALFVFETSFHPMFSLTQGTSRLPYKYAENR